MEVKVIVANLTVQAHLDMSVMGVAPFTDQGVPGEIRDAPLPFIVMRSFAMMVF